MAEIEILFLAKLQQADAFRFCERSGSNGNQTILAAQDWTGRRLQQLWPKDIQFLSDDVNTVDAQ